MLGWCSAYTAGLLLGGTHQHATFGQPERQFSGFRASSRDMVVTTVGANFIAGLQWKEAFIPTLELGISKDRTNDRAGFFSITRPWDPPRDTGTRRG